MDFCRFIGRSHDIQRDWFVDMETHFGDCGFSLKALVEDARGRQYTDIVQAIQSEAQVSDHMQNGDSVSNVLDVCRFGLDLSTDELLGPKGDALGERVAAHVQHTTEPVQARQVTSVAFEGHAFKVSIVQLCVSQITWQWRCNW